MEKELELYIKANYAKLEGDTLVAVRDAFEAAWQARVPEGFVVVPKEPTHEMIDAAIGNNGHIESIYRDMIEESENEK